MRQTLGDRLRIVYTEDEEHELFTSHAWRRLFEIMASLVQEFILEFFSTCRMSDREMDLDIADTLCFQLGGARRRKSGARLSEGHFIMCLAVYFGLVSDKGLRGLSVVTHENLLIDLHELGRLNIYDAPIVNEGAQADPVPMQAPQPPPPAPRTMQQRISKLEEEAQELRQSIVGLRGDVARSITDQGSWKLLIGQTKTPG
nr:hypothetical protein [Tanacetum cinerariifolium]